MYRNILLFSLFLFHVTHGMEPSADAQNALWRDVTSKQSTVAHPPSHKCYGETRSAMADKSEDGQDTDKDLTTEIAITDKDLMKEICEYATPDEEGNMQVDIDFLLRHVICNNYNPKCIRAIIALDDTHVINKVTTQREDPDIPTSRHIFVTPLYLAVMKDNVDAVKLLLDCPLTQVNKTVPLYRAVRNENVEIVKLLLAHPKIQINAVDAYGETALFAAAVIPGCDLRLYKNRLSCIVALLINAGIDSSIENNNGKTALDVEYHFFLTRPVKRFNTSDQRPVDYRILAKVFGEKNNV